MGARYALAVTITLSIISFGTQNRAIAQNLPQSISQPPASWVTPPSASSSGTNVNVTASAACGKAGALSSYDPVFCSFTYEDQDGNELQSDYIPFGNLTFAGQVGDLLQWYVPGGSDNNYVGPPSTWYVCYVTVTILPPQNPKMPLDNPTPLLSYLNTVFYSN